jgi:hypothetical protein
VTHRSKLGAGKELRFEGAASRTIGDDFVTAEPGDSGSDSEVPSLQGLVGLTLPMAGRSLGVGVYGHWGDEDLHNELGGEPVDLETSSWGAYLTLPLGSAVTLSGEAWAGTNMDDYMGGIGQGITVSKTTAKSVAAHGGWAELASRMGYGTYLNVGYSLDDPDAADLAKGARDRNTTLWTTLSHDPGGGLRYGLEVSRWETRYLQAADGKSWRVQTSVTYSF